MKEAAAIPFGMAAASLFHDFIYLLFPAAGALVLFLPCGVGVGAEGGTGVVVARHDRYRLDVHAIVEGQGGEGVAQVMEPKAFQASIFQNPLVEGGHRVRVIHASGAGGGEHPGIVRVLSALLDQEVYGILGDGGFLHGPLVVSRCGGSDIGLGVELKPLAALIIPGGASPLPLPILSVSDVALAVGSLLCHHLPFLCRRASQANCSSSSWKKQEGASSAAISSADFKSREETFQGNLVL